MHVNTNHYAGQKYVFLGKVENLKQLFLRVCKSELGVILASKEGRRRWVDDP